MQATITGLTAANNFMQHHDGAAEGGALAIGSGVQGQLLRAGVAGTLGGLAGLALSAKWPAWADGWRPGAVCLQLGQDGIFGQGHHAAPVAAQKKALVDNDKSDNPWISGHALWGWLTGSGEAMPPSCLIQAARPRRGRKGPSRSSKPQPDFHPATGAAAAGRVNSNNTQTVNVGGINVTVNATGSDACAGQSVASSIAQRLRAFLTHSAGPGEGTTSAPASVGAHS